MRKGYLILTLVMALVGLGLTACGAEAQAPHDHAAFAALHVDGACQEPGTVAASAPAPAALSAAPRPFPAPSARVPASLGQPLLPDRIPLLAAPLRI